MIYRKFGNTGAEISALGYGCMRLPEAEADGKWTLDYDKATEMLRHAHSLGVNYYDTAFFYCHENSEIAVGKAIKPFRNEIYLSTKCPMEPVKSKEDYRGFLEKSLKKLDTDYIDFYHFWAINKKVFDEKIMGLGLIEEALKLKEEGLIRHISFSFHDNPKYIAQIIDAVPELETMLVQYNLLDRSNAKGIDYAASKGVGVVAMGPVAGGRLAAPAALNEKLGAEEAIADYDLALRYVLDNQNISCALSGMENKEMVEKNVAVITGDLKLKAAEKKTIVRTRKIVKKFRELYCTGCGYCQPCPKSIKIPTVFEAYTTYNVYGLSEQAKEKYTDYLSEGGATSESCTNCGLCEKKCPQKLKVRELMKKAEETLNSL